MRETPASTSTVDEGPEPISSTTRPRDIFWNALSSRFSTVLVWKPGTEMVSVYLLATREGSVKMPESFVVVVRSELVDNWTAWTVAPGTGESLRSTTVPEMEPSPPCANAATEKRQVESIPTKLIFMAHLLYREVNGGIIRQPCTRLPRRNVPDFPVA